jgi:DNA-binding NtrC family response regulator
LAERGVLFIDEIGDLDLSLQPKLLRAIERREVRRLGAHAFRRVDVRIIAATRRNLDQEVQEGRFRDDLFHRVAVTRIELPPLRARQGDVELLARHFWEQAGGAPGDFPHSVLERWRTAAWPGNVRELRNAVDRLRALGMEVPTSSPSVAVDTLDVLLSRRLPFGPARDLLLAEFERRYVEDVLEQHEGDPTKAAQASGIGLRYFQKLRARSRK